MSHKIDRGWLFTEMSCADGKLMELGVNDQSWEPCAFKLENVYGFKRILHSESTDKSEVGKTLIFFGDYSYIVNIEYGEFVTLFMKGVK